MSYHIDIQHACDDRVPIDDQTMSHWAQLTIEAHKESGELTLRLVNPEEITELNKTYRQQNKPTNVLAFPAHIPEIINLEYPFLGDVIICPSVLKTESISLEKPLTAHWAHIVIHGVLHLLGYDHVEEKDAEVMQSLETKLLKQLGFDNPYEVEDDTIK